ncbi:MULTISPECIES: 2-isopropylmalate synthase [Psychrobacter]|uniref:2-isopropylmalate synthase n=1 Tax=Psychrobacter TaxID=497 RepID=UPI00086B57B5|nr:MULTISPECIES: 2-isopropylmalate synthase [Psychrobacter]MBA6244851.1 2-isopropylmalate synthase [Psychrobacter sp. Urea-trap-18]MBA6285987.1 2-isopropylmalate synthase [Psychrobacter sp. Urea-trap-16]MBA6317103.1 2-isopropylmalate synthase [Psychrobacter sp. Urea-trap-20]MBA6333134.1 2-isopropylmalate synthase [Psychrobacter sp. Urea-trap-19]OEH68937.1 MAG: 2-isopropylmalate synthase [Psychrobacter sp. B29-1]|tara:strand:- start:1942 stop:3726 length:1785 start_codon:yes stop_codon:yes gene_type:complete
MSDQATHTAATGTAKITPKSAAFDFRKYRPFAFAPSLPDRTWPSKTIEKSPIWASVDLRDGNQALIDPMTIEQKMRFFKTLVDVGFKEIEIGFPSAAQVEFDFARKLIEENHVPEDVTLQVLVQAREHLIARTFESLKGAKRAVVHVYNSTSRVQREKVYGKDKAEIKEIAIAGAKLLQEYAAKYPETDWVFQYSPESFSQTETEYAVEVCDAVCDVWQPQQGQEVIFNLPATVEASMPNVFADQVEYFCRNLAQREHVIVSLHTHNDRGCAVAAAELGVLAGADRIEGTLLGNGERTGNMDIMVMAMNLFSQGIDPELDFSNMSEIVQVVSECNNLPLHPRHPYVGELVFTAFSGSHQDAIKKSLDYNESNQSETDNVWDVAYLPIDPAHIGRSYQDVVRINSQSGKGGVAYILQRNYGFNLPRWMQIDFSRVVQKQAEAAARELQNDEILQTFEDTYLQQGKFELLDYSVNNKGGAVYFSGQVQMNSDTIDIDGTGNGPLSSFIDGLAQHTGKSLHIINYTEHAINPHHNSGNGIDDDTNSDNKTNANAAAYIQLNVDGEVYSGIGTCSSTVSAMLKGALSAFAQALNTEAA